LQVRVPFGLYAQRVARIAGLGQDSRADVVVTATAYAFDRDHVHAYGFGNVTANDNGHA
jgi:hypothetical protein